MNTNKDKDQDAGAGAKRREKLQALKEAGFEYPNDFSNPISLSKIALLDSLNSIELEKKSDQIYRVAGRIVLCRRMGKATFLQIQDFSGRLQLYLRRDQIENYDNVLTFDLGDIIGAEGKIFRTRTGELTLGLSSIRILTKSLLPLPEKFHGLHDSESCYRYRYLDLIANISTRRTFKLRSQIIRKIRDFFDRRGFFEVETPMLQAIPTGAAATPFLTHHKTLDMDVYLRIAPELYLKRLLVGGFDRVYEVNRNFRNEGISRQHNPEFTMLEFYQAYATYYDLIDLTEELLDGLVREFHGTSKIFYQGKEIDFTRPFQRLTMRAALLKYCPGLTDKIVDDFELIKSFANSKGIKIESFFRLGKIQSLLFEECVEHLLINPTFITEYPREISPLARLNDKNPDVTDRFELFINGFEIANAFSELNDPDDQLLRFQEQQQNRDDGDNEAFCYDADFIRALQYGMPPAAGEGIGIDRLIMLLTDSGSIRDVILFPLLRQKQV